MAGALVLFVLLDGFAELPNNFNKILRNEFMLSRFNVTNTQVCEPKVAKYVLDEVKYFNADNPDPNRNYFDFDTVETQEKLISNDIYNEHTIFENSIADLVDDNSTENDHQLITINDAEYDNDSMSKFNKLFGLNTALNVTESLPSLVAIFETLSNVTAQTCAGTLLSSNWIITAASCVNILAGICSKETNCTKTSRYTVVAGSSNPLVDGSIHNVTEILLHPEPKLSNDQKIDANPVLAMMRIDPGYKPEKMGIWSGEAEENMNARVYGWTLLKQESGLDVMKISSVPVRAVSYTRCQLEQVTSTSGLCFDIEINGNNTQLGTGGPVLLEKGRSRMLAVVLDDRAPLLAEPLAAHTAWVQRVIKNPL